MSRSTSSPSPRRFVWLRHTLPEDAERSDHWDLMIETCDKQRLATWAFLEDPTRSPRQAVTRLADHRTRYLDYEGPVSGNRGAVQRRDAGWCRVLRADADHWEVILEGAYLRGKLRLSQRHGETLPSAVSQRPPNDSLEGRGASWSADFASLNRAGDHSGCES